MDTGEVGAAPCMHVVVIDPRESAVSDVSLFIAVRILERRTTCGGLAGGVRNG